MSAAPKAHWRAELARARRFARRLDDVLPDTLAPIPPPDLPPGRIVNVPSRGEMFVRDTGPERPSERGSGPERPSERGSGPERPSERPTIALLHGWTASADLNWFRAYARLSGIGRVIAMDHRGHGRGLRSDERFTLEAAADDAAALLRELGAAPAILVGYSMGGPISLHTARRHPDVVQGLVLEATALEWRASARERLIWKTMAIIEWLLRIGRPKGLLERGLRDAVDQSPDLAPLLGWLRGELRRGDPEALADAGRALGNYDFRPFAAGIAVPTAVVVTTKDRLVRPRKQRSLARAIPRSRVYEIAGDHDAALVLGEAFPSVTEDAVRWVLGEVAPTDQADASAAAATLRRTAG
jgi:pimeloyl-ACP methyl ester carboxylesterase